MLERYRGRGMASLPQDTDAYPQDAYSLTGTLQYNSDIYKAKPCCIRSQGSVKRYIQCKGIYSVKRYAV